MNRSLLRLLACLAAAATPLATRAASGADEAFFENKVRPILAEHCLDCHDAETAKNKLRLDTTLGLLRGGESGEPLFIAGLSSESYLIKRVTSDTAKEMMPPKGERLSAAEVAVLKTWIDGGAKMPGAAEAVASLRLKTDHWSFQPVKRPAVKHEATAIDELLLAKAQEKGLAFSPAADKATLIRRLYLIMHGMPPTPQEVADFIQDKSADAYPRLVDRVLTSPRYGERWARHWMDVVRYADTNGFETNRERKSAYPYRDYIITSLNADKPYDQFIKEQIAGDSLGVDAATGFLVAGPYDVVKSPNMALTLMQRQDELADMVSTTGTAFLGLSMGCARCHNHKFDPILQKDYYAMQAIFAGVRHGERPLREALDSGSQQRLAKMKADEAKLTQALQVFRAKAVPMAVPKAVAEATAKPTQREAVSAQQTEETFVPVETQSIKFTILASSSGQPCVDELEIFNEAGENVALASKGAKASVSGSLSGYAIHKLEHINDGQVGNDHSWISNTSGTGWVQIDLPAKARINRVVWSRDRTGRLADRVVTDYRIEAVVGAGQWQTLATANGRSPFKGGKGKAKIEDDAFIAKLNAEDAVTARKLFTALSTLKASIDKANAVAWVGTFNAKPELTHRLYRGEPMQQREVVAPDALSVLGTLGLDVDAPEQQRRTRLAEWIASPQNPLTARVLVNRLWHYIFGHGIVDTPSDFGANGTRPTHPELLDWLADEFMKSGWSIKHVQRLILLSAAFQQGSAPLADALKIDADGRYLWRFTPRRLEAEAIRDSMLVVSGALDLKMGGPGFYLMDVVPENVMHYFPKETYTTAEYRRMVYLFRVRAAQDGVFGSFDCPDGGSVMAKRSRSNTPLQALNLFNSSFIIQQADILANRLSSASASPEAQVNLAFQLFYARAPDAYELSNSVKMIEANGLPSFARALYNTSEFLFVF